MRTSFSYNNWLRLLILLLSLIFIVQDVKISLLSHAQDTESIRFAVIGDYGDSNDPFWAEVAVMVRGWNPDFIVTTGDNNYPDGEAETIDANIGQFFHDYIYPYQGEYGDGAEENRFFPVIGNHDYTLEDSLDPYLDYFTLPNNERYYDFVWGSIHFFMLNSDDRELDGNEEDSIQGQWLKEGLAESDSLWKVVVLHESPYSSGWHGDEADVQWPYAEWGADVVFSGHDHHYERIVLDGLPFIVNGIGGDNLREIENVRSGSRFRYNSDYGAMLVTVDADTMRFEFHTIQGKPLTWENAGHLDEWLELDVSAAVTGEGEVNFGLATGSASSAYFSSREGEYPPELLIETDESDYTLTAIADSYINSEQLERNYGDDETLRVRYNYPNDFNTYLRFDVQGIRGNIEKATLRLYIVDGEVKGGFAVYPITEMLNDDETVWTEENITAETAPLLQGIDEPLDVFTLRKD